MNLYDGRMERAYGRTFNQVAQLIDAGDECKETGTKCLDRGAIIASERFMHARTVMPLPDGIGIAKVLVDGRCLMRDLK